MTEQALPFFISIKLLTVLCSLTHCCFLIILPICQDHFYLWSSLVKCLPNLHLLVSWFVHWFIYLLPHYLLSSYKCVLYSVSWCPAGYQSETDWFSVPWILLLVFHFKTLNSFTARTLKHHTLDSSMSSNYQIVAWTEGTCSFSHRYSYLKISNVYSNSKGILPCWCYFRYTACFENDKLQRP